MTAEQNSRYKELMWIAEHGDYMSDLEYNELNRLLSIQRDEYKAKGKKW